MADDSKFTQADIDAAIKKATDKLQESIDRLESKNTELVGDLRKARKAGEIKPEDLEAAEKRADTAEARVKELEKTAKDATTAKEKAEKALVDEQGFTQKLLIQDGLKSALLENGVKDPDFIDSLTAKFASGSSIKVDGDKREAMYGDKKLGEAIKEWAGSEAGKKFVAAPANSGSGAPGGHKGATAAKTMTRAEYDALDQNAKAALGADMAKGELKLVDNPV